MLALRGTFACYVPADVNYAICITMKDRIHRSKKLNTKSFLCYIIKFI